MNVKRYLMGKLSIHYSPWQKWNHVSVGRYWSVRLFNLNISKFTITLDCRINWLEDMVSGKPA